MSSMWTLCLALLSVPAAGAANPDPEPASIYRLKSELAGEIQAKILDPILGAGRSHVFADFEPEVRREHEVEDRNGTGLAIKLSPGNENDGREKKTSTTSGRDHFKGFGFNNISATSTIVGLSSGTNVTPAGKNALREAKGVLVENTWEQRAEQARGISEQRLKLNLRLTGLRVLVIHDAAVPQDRLETAKRLILSAYAADLRPANLSFKPVPFARR
ncbi:MAG: hypothetical protein HY077_09160 [Elusimicrobia bacterium]|nr:hypothetical protein [Elusimicrobiota bacterium]